MFAFGGYFVLLLTISAAMIMAMAIITAATMMQIVLSLEVDVVVEPVDDASVTATAASADDPPQEADPVNVAIIL